MTTLTPAEPSEGVFFVVPLPTGWQLCSFRQDEYGPIGVPDCWVHVLDPFLTIWFTHLAREGPVAFMSRHSSIQEKLGQLVADFDAFPRGEIRRCDNHRHYVVHHGGEISRAMHVPRHEIEDAFGITGRAKWVEDTAHVSDHRHAQRIRALLPIADKWEDAG